MIREPHRKERNTILDFYLNKGSGYVALESIRSQIYSYEHLPHTDFLDKGIQSATLYAYMGDSQEASKRSESVDKLIKAFFKMI